MTQKMSHDDARTQARTLGLREDREGVHRDLWQAAKKLENTGEE